MKIIKLNLKISHKPNISAWHCSSSKHNISAFYKVLLQFRPRKTQTNQCSKKKRTTKTSREDGFRCNNKNDRFKKW